MPSVSPSILAPPHRPPLDLPVGELGEEIALLAAQLDAGTHRLLTCIRQFDVAEGWHGQGAQSCAHWLTWRIGLDVATAREKVRVARALGSLPALDAALAAGRLSYAKVRAITRVATPQTEARLLEMALVTTGAQMEHICRRFRGLRVERMGEAGDEQGQGGDGQAANAERPWRPVPPARVEWCAWRSPCDRTKPSWS